MYCTDFSRTSPSSAYGCILRTAISPVLLDYETVSVALYQVADNAVKYVMPNSNIDISFSAEATWLSVVVQMLSLPISEDEVPRICEEGFSGHVAQSLGLAGDRIGMSRTRDLLRLNRATVIMVPNIAPSDATTHNGMPYERNEVRIKLRRPDVGRTNH